MRLQSAESFGLGNSRRVQILASKDSLVERGWIRSPGQ
jgi:hypothetical protein